MKSGIEVISYTDPYCTWCWGSEPILRKLEEVYGDQLTISYVMGGLVEDMRKFSDPGAGIGGELWYKQVADHWLEASERHRMPVDEQICYDIKDDVFSTYPAGIAFKAAQFQGKENGNRYLRRLREAGAAERLVIQNTDVQGNLAEEIGLDRDKFLEAIENGKAEKAFREDLKECREKGVRGFPTFLLRGNEKEILLRGYSSYVIFENWFKELTNNKIEAKELKGESTDVYSFISKYGKAAPMEVAIVYELSLADSEKLLKEMTLKGLITETKAGNGFFYSLPQKAMECDVLTGKCL